MPLPALADSPSAPHSSKNPLYIPTLDGWRALAILMVIAAHSSVVFNEFGPFPFHPAVRALLPLAHGVDLFFALSGFLICTLLLRERHATGTLSLSRFYTRRAFRILPAYWVYLAFLALLIAMDKLIHVPNELWWCFFFINDYLPPSLATIGIGSFWSLAVEEHFYLFIPLLIKFLPRRPLFWTIASLAILVFLWRMLDDAYVIIGYLYNYDQAVNPYVRTDDRLDGLLWGCAAAILMENPRARAVLNEWLFPSAVVILAVVTGFHVCLDPFGSYITTALLLPLIIAGTVLYPHSLLGRCLEWAPLRFIGRISFSLYIWQQLFLVPQPVLKTLGPLQDFPYMYISIIAFSLASYYLIERPFLGLGRRLSPPPVRTPTPSE